MEGKFVNFFLIVHSHSLCEIVVAVVERNLFVLDSQAPSLHLLLQSA